MKTMTNNRSYSELSGLQTFEDRFEYLKLSGVVAGQTFGHERWMNQRFYTSYEWRKIRQYVIARDNGCDLGVDGYYIADKLYIHHMNPMSSEDLRHSSGANLDPEFLITVTHRTHNAIHYGSINTLPRLTPERRPGDTVPWRKN